MQSRFHTTSVKPRLRLLGSHVSFRQHRTNRCVGSCQLCANSSHLAGLLDHLVGASSHRRHGEAEHPCQALDTAPYGFGETRVATLALLTLTALSGWCSCGVVITKF